MKRRFCRKENAPIFVVVAGLSILIASGCVQRSGPRYYISEYEAKNGPLPTPTATPAPELSDEELIAKVTPAIPTPDPIPESPPTPEPTQIPEIPVPAPAAPLAEVEQVEEMAAEIVKNIQPCYVTEKLPPRTVTRIKKVMVEPERTVTNVMTGNEVWEDQEVMVRPEREVLKVIPAVFDWVDDPLADGGRRKVVVSPARTERVLEPAEYRKQRVRVSAGPKVTETKVIPARYEDMEVKETAPGKTVDVQVVCEEYRTVSLVRKIQKALKKNGYDPNEASGSIGQGTEKALSRFIADKGLLDVPWSTDVLTALSIKGY